MTTQNRVQPQKEKPEHCDAVTAEVLMPAQKVTPFEVAKLLRVRDVLGSMSQHGAGAETRHRKSRQATVHHWRGWVGTL